MKIDPKDVPGPDSPWDYPGFVFASGRYYDRMGCIELSRSPTYPFGGDISYLLWRFDNNPGEWIRVYRFRKYAGPNSNPWTGGDKKTWHAAKGPDLEKMRGAFNEMEKAAKDILNRGKPVGHDVFKIEGDMARFEKLMESPPDWMHKKIVHVPQ